MHTFHHSQTHPGRCHARCPDRACTHAGLASACLTALVGRANTRVLRRCSSGNVPQGGGFSRMLFCGAAKLPKAVDWLPVPSLRQIACVVSGAHGSVFTTGPLPVNPYTIQFSRYCSRILCSIAQSGNARVRGRNRLTTLSRGVACGGLKPYIVTHQNKIERL